jgi:hypothetical protein
MRYQANRTQILPAFETGITGRNPHGIHLMGTGTGMPTPTKKLFGYDKRHSD